MLRTAAFVVTSYVLGYTALAVCLAVIVTWELVRLARFLGRRWVQALEQESQQVT
jgi:hypothetical protein